MSSLLEKDSSDVLNKSALEIFEGLNFDIDQENSHQLVQFKSLIVSLERFHQRILIQDIPLTRS